MNKLEKLKEEFTEIWQPDMIERIFQKSSEAALRKHFESDLNELLTEVAKDYEDILKWIYVRSIGNDNIMGLDVCDNYLKWRKNLEIDLITETKN